MTQITDDVYKMRYVTNTYALYHMQSPNASFKSTDKQVVSACHASQATFLGGNWRAILKGQVPTEISCFYDYGQGFALLL